MNYTLIPGTKDPGSCAAREDGRYALSRVVVVPAKKTGTAWICSTDGKVAAVAPADVFAGRLENQQQQIPAKAFKGATEVVLRENDILSVRKRGKEIPYPKDKPGNFPDMHYVFQEGIQRFWIAVDPELLVKAAKAIRPRHADRGVVLMGIPQGTPGEERGEPIALIPMDPASDDGMALVMPHGSRDRSWDDAACEKAFNDRMYAFYGDWIASMPSEKK